jgi:lipid A 3-O-deacylase
VNVMIKGLLAALFALIAATGVSAEQDEPSGLWVVEYENDLFAGEDRYYSSGIRLSRIGLTRNPPSWLESVARRFPGFDDAEALPYSLSIAHNIFTPADVENPEFPPDDRLYAGWLHLKFSTGTLHSRGADRVRVGIGIAGPAAMGKQIQKGIHRLVDADRPVGWSEQLRNEPTLLLGYDRFRRLFEIGTPSGMRLDFNTLGGVTLGNAYTNLSAGAFVRWGSNMANDYGPPRITPAVSGSSYFQPRENRSWYLYLGTEGRAVGRDLFIEGNTFGGRDGVEARRLVGELFGGIVFTQGPFRLAYTHVWRSREFVGQEAAQDYGALSMSLWW